MPGYHGAEDRLSTALFCARKGWRCRHHRDETVRKTYGAGETLYRQPLPHTALQLKERTPEGKTETAETLLCVLRKKADGTEYFRDLSAFFGLYGRCGRGCGSDGD